MLPEKGVLLLSGGFDSPVAGKLMINKGMKLIAVHFSLEPFTDNTPEIKAKKCAEKIGCEKMIVVKNGEQHAEIVKKCDNRYYYIITRRLMWRIAQEIAKKEGAEVLVTGENLGQVGSQTLENMFVTNASVSMPILRPLLCYDKQEIIEKAKEIGTHDISVGPELCCVLGPKHPATRSRLEIIEKEERKLDIPNMVKEALHDTEIQL